MDILTIHEICEATGGTCSAQGEVSSVCIDSRQLEAGCLFIAIRGENFDGHSFVKAALANGAACAMCDTPVEGADGPIIMVEDTRRAFLDLAKYYRERFRIPVIGLTGSVGKTTTKEMIAAVLRRKLNVLATEGNLNNDIGLPRMCMRLDRTMQAAVLEMGMSHFGEISLLSKTASPTIGVITNIGVSHIENLGSQEGILKAKMEILEGMSLHAPLVLNGDDEHLLKAAKEWGIVNPVTLYAIDNPEAECRATDIEQTESGMKFTLTYKGESCAVEIPAIGIHNVYNALAAFVCGRLCSLSTQECVEGLRDYIPAGMRQRIVQFGGFTVIEDCYNASPDSIRAALSVLRNMPGSGKRIAVLGEMMELGDYARKAHHDCGAMAAQSEVDYFFALGTGNAMYYIEGASELLLKGKAKLFDSKEELVEQLAATLETGDVVLFKASRAVKLEEVIEQLYAKLG